jgi:cell wall-associated NlpC family hydrolase
MNHTWLLRTPADAAACRAKGCVRLPFAEGVFRLGRGRAVVESPVLEAPGPFDNAVGSWNADLPPGARLEMEARVRLEGGWSSWYRLGSAEGRPGRRLKLRSPGPQEDAHGKVASDTLLLKSPASALRWRLRLQAGRGAVVLRQAAFTASDPQAPAAPPPFRPGPWVRRLPVRGRSQFAETDDCRGSICSPTSLAAVLEYWGLRRPTLDMAGRVRDGSCGDFGNWPFNTAAAGALGFDAHVARLESLDDLADEVAAGRPVVVSLTFGPGELPGSPIPQTKGHLMVVTGFSPRGDVLVMDPAGKTARQTPRAYGRAAFHRAWRVNKRGLSYIISPRVRGRRLTVAVPAAGLWDKPLARRRFDLLALDHHSQLLYGERVTTLAGQGPWLKVRTEEPEHLDRQGRWRGCTGWLRADQLTAAPPPAPDCVVRTRQAILKAPGGLLTLSVGTRLARLAGRGAARVRLLDGSAAEVPADALAPLRTPDPADRRALVLKTAELFLGTRYYWGGRSGVQEEPSTGVDCSGLVCLAYRVCGLDLPHNAQEQLLRSRMVPPARLAPGDAVFLSAGEDRRRITHVMLYTGGDGLIESRWAAGCTLRCTFAERFGLPLAEFKAGALVTDRTFPQPRRRRVFFGSFL